MSCRNDKKKKSVHNYVMLYCLCHCIYEASARDSDIISSSHHGNMIYFLVLLFSSVWQFHENCNYRPMGLRQPWLDDDCSLSSFFLIFFFFVLLFHSSPLSALEMMEITTKHHHLEFRLVARIVSTASSFSECEGRDICSDRVDDHNNFGTRKLWTLSEFTWS